MIKFVGHERLPQPLRPDEVNRLLGIADEAEQEEPKEEIPFLVGQAVAITEGPFTDFNGTVEEVMADKGKVRVSCQPVRAADVRGAGLPAAEGVLSGDVRAVTVTVDSIGRPRSTAATPRCRHRHRSP